MFFLCVLSPTPVKRVKIGLSFYSYIFVIDGGPKGVGSSRIWGCTLELIFSIYLDMSLDGYASPKARIEVFSLDRWMYSLYSLDGI